MEDFYTVVHTNERDRWLAERRKGIGGSDAPAILGLVPWASPTSIQADKWGLLDEPAEVELLQWGRKLEGVILEGLAERIGEPVHPFGFLIRSQEREWLQCTPDGQTESGLYVQAKNQMRADEWEERPPERVWVQVQHEMAVTGHEQCYVVALLLGYRLVWCRVDRSQSFIDDVLLPAEEKFWKLTQEREPAPPDASEHTKRALQLIYPEDSGETITLDGSFVDLDRERKELAIQKKTAESRLLEIDNQFRHAMRDATFAALPNGVRYSLKHQHRKAYTVEASDFRVLRRLKEKQ